MANENLIFQLWVEIKDIINSLEEDIVKTAKGNLSAGIRIRKNIILAEKKTSELKKASLKRHKEVKETKSLKIEAAKKQFLI